MDLPRGIVRWLSLRLSSAPGQEGSGHSSTSQHEAPQPAIQDNTDNNVQDLKNQLAAERQKEAQAAAAQAPQTNAASMGGTPAQQVVAAAWARLGRWTRAHLANRASNKESMRNHSFLRNKQQAQQLAARERELAYNARFASNLVYTHSSDAQAASRTDPNPHLDGETQTAVSQPPNQTASSLISTREASEKKSNSTDDSAAKRSAEVNIDSAVRPAVRDL